jgi:hypothetical protein
MWFGRDGRHGVCSVVDSCCDFQIMTPNAYIFMYAFHIQFNHDHVNTFSNLRRKKQEEKRQ